MTKTLNLYLQFELKELKRRQEEEERKRQEELTAKQTPPPSSPDDQPSERSVEFLLLFLVSLLFLHFLLFWWEWMCACVCTQAHLSKVREQDWAFVRYMMSLLNTLAAMCDIFPYMPLGPPEFFIADDIWKTFFKLYGYSEHVNSLLAHMPLLWIFAYRTRIFGVQI